MILASTVIASASVTKLLIGVPTTLAILAAFYRGLVRLDRSPKRVAIVTIVVALLIVESVLYSQNETPFGIFHPQIGSQNFRLYDVLIPLALVARLRSRGLPRRISASGVLWVGFFAWYAACAVTGYLGHHTLTNITFESKALIYLGGSMLVVSGFNVRELLGPHGPLRLVRPAAVFSGAVAAVGLVHLTINIPVSGIKIVGLNGVPEDAASILISLGVLAFMIELCRPKRSASVLICCAVMVVSTLTSGQRATLVQLAVTLILAAAAWLLPTARRRSTVTPTQALVIALVIAVLFVGPSVLRGQSPWQVSAIPFGSKIENALTNQAKTQSAQQRINELQQLEIYVPQRLVTGWGLGRTVTYYATGTYSYPTKDITDGIVGDLLLRGGVIALGLLVAAVGSVLWEGISVWRHHRDRVAAAASLACATILVGLLAKGLVESIFEKYRVAIVLGLMLGLARALITSAHEPHDSTPASSGATQVGRDVGASVRKKGLPLNPSGRPLRSEAPPDRAEPSSIAEPDGPRS